MVEFVWQQQRRETWSTGRPGEGVVLKKTRGQYVCAPRSLVNEPGGIFEAVRDMNVKVALTVNTPLMKMICAQERRGTIVVGDGLRLQVLGSVQDLPRCQKHQFAAFVADTGSLVVWDDDPYHLVERTKELEAALLRMNWGRAIASDDEKAGDGAEVAVAEISPDASMEDLELADEKARPTRYLAPIMVACTITLLVGALGLGWRQLASEYQVDPKYALPRLALIAIAPLQAFLSLVCSLVIRL